MKQDNDLDDLYMDYVHAKKIRDGCVKNVARVSRELENGPSSYWEGLRDKWSQHAEQATQEMATINDKVVKYNLALPHATTATPSKAVYSSTTPAHAPVIVYRGGVLRVGNTCLSMEQSGEVATAIVQERLARHWT